MHPHHPQIEKALASVISGNAAEEVYDELITELPELGNSFHTALQSTILQKTNGRSQGNGRLSETYQWSLAEMADMGD